MKMISRENLPDDAADWNRIPVFFSRLTEDTPSSCPYSPEELFQYVQTESSDTSLASKDRFMFLRTAQLGDAQFWLWSYEESDGEQVLVACRLSADRSTSLILASPNGLTAEQFMLAEYYDEIYWS